MLAENSKLAPNLIIPGFPKSGTSSLFDYLCQHPDIFRPKIKEPHTYAINRRFNDRFSRKGRFNFKSMYANAKDFKYIPDASTIYMISDKAITRILHDNSKDLKFIIIARDPIERVFSHYNWLRSLGYQQESFKKEVLNQQSKQFNAENDIRGNYKNYIQFSQYGSQLKRLFESVDNDKIFIVSLENLKSEFDQTINQIFNFLDLRPINISMSLINKTANFKTLPKRKLPTKIKIMEKKIGSKKISNSFIFSKKIKPVNFNYEHEKFIYELIKDDLYILKENNLLFSEWKTVNKFMK